MARVEMRNGNDVIHLISLMEIEIERDGRAASACPPLSFFLAVTWSTKSNAVSFQAFFLLLLLLLLLLSFPFRRLFYGEKNDKRFFAAPHSLKTERKKVRKRRVGESEEKE